jgi:hypothetical protein
VTEQAEHAEKLARREALQAEGKKPRGRPPEPPSPEPGEEDQVNFTDEESRIMKTEDGFQQCYNAQAGWTPTRAGSWAPASPRRPTTNSSSFPPSRR